jgi:citrate lyase subunit beta/citryl-CoA lyase
MIRPRRSVLYMPGSNARALEKAKVLPADALILDLEDAVAPDAKESARQQVAATVRGGGYGPREVVVRINGLDTPWGHADLDAAAAAGPDGILVPKVSAARDVFRVGEALRRAGAPPRTRVWAMMETPLAVLNAAAIATTAKSPEARLACLVMGTNDLIKETRADARPDRVPALYWLSACVTAARAFGLDILDGVYNDFRDAEGCRRECEQGRALGFDGKTLIHPDQVAIANEVFAPSAAEVERARAIMAAFERPENKGKGVITIDGRMVELLHADIARRTLAIAEAIAARQAS